MELKKDLGFYANGKISSLNKAFAPTRKMGKHQASKKGYKHVKNFSKGELNHKKFVGGK